MGERTHHAPGTFSWIDLSTTDQEGAKSFYAGVFGWDFEDMPAGEGVVYSMARMGGKDVAAISPQPEQLRDAGVPPTWNSYVTVTSADETAETAKQLGGNVQMPPFDVFDAGRMAVIQDPHGAFFMIWEPKQNIGAHLVNAPGALVWNELASSDFDASSAFYSGLFGWEIAQFEGSPQPYLAIMNGESRNGGIREPNEGEPPYRLVYFGTDDIDAALARAEELGGTKLAGPIDIQIAKIGIVQDPQGAVFALYAGTLDP